jgi:hypothetical protein
MSSNGLGFEEFMRKLVTAPIPEKKPRKSRAKTSADGTAKKAEERRKAKG